MSNVNTNRSNTNLGKRLSKIIAGTQAHPPSGPVTLGGTSYTAAALEALFQGLLDALGAADDARAALHEAVLKAKTTKASVSPVLGAYASYLVATYGSSVTTLADFGLAPRKTRTPLTADEVAASVAKRKATRAARHTMGSVQKIAVKGDVTGVTVMPITAPQPVATTPTGPTAGAPSPAATTTSATHTA